MHTSPLSKIGAPLVTEYPPRRRWRISRRMAWQLAYMAVDAILLTSAAWALLTLLGVLFAALPPIA